MFKIWKANTITFVFQIVMGAVVYMTTDGNVYAAWLVAALSALAIAVIGFGTPVFYIAMAAFMPAALRGLSADFDLPEVIVSVLNVALMTTFAVAQERREGVQGAFPLLFLAALPFGIGSVLAGIIMGARRLAYLVARLP